MKNRKEVFKEARTKPLVVWNDFINIFKKHKREQKNNNFIYCFYEGKDDSKYYNNRIETIQELSVSHFESKGKENLLSLYEIIQKRKKVYSEGKLSFFIDKDYDDMINPIEFEKWKKKEDLYVTSTYSIENFYTTLNVFQKILKSEFILESKNSLKETDNEFEILSKLFSDRQSEFHQFMLDINTWIATQNYFLRETDEYRNISFSDLSLFNKNNPIIKLSLNEVRLNQGNILIFLENKYTESFKISDINVQFKFDEFKEILSQNKQMNFRGKFEEEFLNKFLQILIEECNKSKLDYIGIHAKIKTNLVLNNMNLLSSLSQYSDIPSCLKSFLKK